MAIGKVNISGGVARSKQITNLTAKVGFPEMNKVTLSWTNPTDNKFKGLRIMFKAGGYPTSPDDGFVFFDSNDGSVPETYSLISENLQEGTEYFFRAFSYTYKNATRIYTEKTEGAQVSAIPFRNKGIQYFTESGTFIPPYGVAEVDVFMVGGGASSNGRAGAGAGYTRTITNIPVTKDTSYPIVVGAGGDKAVDNAPGGSSSFAEYTVSGAPSNASFGVGGKGGSGGGGPGTGTSVYPGNGGSDGSDGLSSTGSGSSNAGGVGQRTTTRAFGEVDGALYAGGGGGGSYQYPNAKGGDGGGGGSNNTGDGVANTGGGASGEHGSTSPYIKHSGGSGIVIVRWGY